MLNLLLRYNKGSSRFYRAVTLEEIGKNEEFLESSIAESPAILNLETKTRGVYGPYKVFRQLNLKTPQGKTIAPDIVLLCQSGHVIIVEVKLFMNPELRDRRVVSQVIDYAAVLSSTSKEELVRIFNKDSKEIKSWNGLVEYFFPEERNVDDLAQTLLFRIQTGRLNMIIACDKAPVGLRDSISNVVKQNTIEFKLDVIEVIPYIDPKDEEEEIIFGCRITVETEVISRTAVTVTFRREDNQPSVDVRTTSIDEIEESINLARIGRRVSDRAREWSNEEVDEHFVAHDDPTIKELYGFCRTHSSNGKVTAPGLKVNPVFGMYATSAKGTKLFLNYIEGNTFLTLFLDMMEELAEQRLIEELRHKLKLAFPTLTVDNVREPSLKIDDLSEGVKKLVVIVEWFQAELDKNPSA